MVFSLDLLSSAALLEMAFSLDNASEEAFRLFTRANYLAEEARDEQGIARSCYGLGLYYLARSRPEQAKDHFLQAYSHAHALEAPWRVNLLTHLTQVHLTTELFDKCYQFGLLALAASRSLQNHTAEAKNLLFLVKACASLGLYQDALGYAFAQLELIKGLPDCAPTDTFRLIASIYRDLGDFQQALDFQTTALDLIRREGDKLQESTVLNEMGINYGRMGQKLHSNTLFQEAIAVALTCDNLRIIFWGYNNFGFNNYLLAAYDEALANLEQAFSYLQQFPYKPSDGALLKTNLGLVHLKQGKFELAQTYLTESLSEALLSKMNQRILEAYEGLYLLHEARGDYQEALEYHKLFYNYKVKILEEAASTRNRALMLKFNIEHLHQEKENYRRKNDELASEMKKFEELSIRDGLTGLYNRRYLDSQLEQTFAGAKRNGHILCVSIADIDNFKRINDQFSHAIGDEVLKTIAEIFLINTRPYDTVARYGGEEIVCIFPETTLDAAKAICERLRQLVENYPWEALHPDLKVTLSMGLADDMTLANHEELVAKADANLYKAKHSGKNKIES